MADALYSFDGGFYHPHPITQGPWSPASAADFANGISRVLDFETHTFINADLTAALARTPRGDWVGFEMQSNISGDGFGQAESRIFDSAATIGRSIQTLVVTEKAAV